MEVWVLEWSHPYDSENNITVWANENDARRQALDEIEDLITNDWDMEDNDAAACADDISDMVARGQLAEAMRRFNDYQDEYNSDYAQYWHVYSRDLLTGDGSKSTMTTPSTYKATTHGATCRGPCKSFNDYAYADRSDGTYVCHQCKTFGHIFNGAP